MTEAERLKVQIALLQDIEQYVVAQGCACCDADELADYLQDAFSRRLIVLRASLKQLERKATAANPSACGQPSRLPQADAERA